MESSKANYIYLNILQTNDNKKAQKPTLNPLASAPAEDENIANL